MNGKYRNLSLGLMMLLLLAGAMPAMAASAKIAVYSDYMSISDTSSDGLSAYADALQAQGYTVEQIYDPITSSELDGCEALLMIGLGRYLSGTEKSAIENFVENQDKGLLLSGGSSGAVNDLAQNFTGGSMEWFGNNIVCDPTDYEVYSKWVKIQTFYDHPITENLGEIIMYKGTNIPAAWAFGGIIGCAYSDDDSWLDEDGDYICDAGESCGAQPVLAYSSWDKIVIVPDGNVFDNSDADGDGVVAFYEYDNDVLGLNVARWLAGDVSGTNVQVTDAKISRGEFVGDWFQEIEEVAELEVGDVFIIKIEVTNVGSETEEVFNLYGWDLSPQTHVDVIGTPSFCLYPFNLQPGESAILYPFCLSEAFEAEEEGWVTMDVLEYGGYTFSFEIIAEEAVNFIGVVENEPSEPCDIGVRIDEIISDPEGKLSIGDLANIDIADDISECDVVWPVHKGDKVEVFAKHYDYDCGLASYDICVWVYSKDNPYNGYLKLVGEPDLIIQDISWRAQAALNRETR